VVSSAAALLLAACAGGQQPAPQSADAMPRAADGKPDLSGVYAGPGFQHTGKETDSATVKRYTEKNMTPVKAEGKALFNRAFANDVHVDDPTAVCLPNGLTRQIPSPYAQEWMYTPDKLIVLYEYMHFFRVIPVGAPNRPHAADAEEDTYMGDSIAWWDNDTLVIDTINLKEWLLDATHGEDGSSRWHSNKAHVIERLTPKDKTNVSYDVTIDDPGVFEGPWTEHWSMQKKSTWKIFEFVCDDNDRCRTGKCTADEVQKNATR
jgi:hypothetical protein